MSYPHNLMVQRSRKKEVIKGSLLFGGLVAFILTLFVLSGYASSGSNAQMLICHEAGGSVSCKLAEN